MVLMGTSIAYGQLTVSRQVIGSAGAQIENNNFSVCNTVGEAVTATFIEGSLTVTQGFQQRSNKVKVSIEVDANHPLSIRIFPNPTTDVVKVVREGQVLTSYEIYALDGRLIKKAPFKGEFVSFAPYAKGTYIIRLFAHEQQLITTAKIIKQ